VHSYVDIFMTKKLISIGETAKLLNVSIDSLRRWDKTHRLSSIRSGPRGRRYYTQPDIDAFLRNDTFLAKQWVKAPVGYTPGADVYSPTRDIFQARLEKLQSVLSHKLPMSEVSLLCAISGEIGNNSFDHNLGNWVDIPGIYFSYDSKVNKIILADRGLGILETLKRVLPRLNDARTALRVAFTETISGRQPEARGNGLKFVREIISTNPFTLSFQTGDACLNLKSNDTDLIISQVETPCRGCFAIIGFT
jgi:hypothetical protein